MSGIAGILRFDGRPVDRRDLERMANALRAHGPDRCEVLPAGQAGFANLLMRMTPEDLLDRQPWRGGSGAVITADVRLDNRSDVVARLDLPQEAATDWADSRLLLTAWERFGNELWYWLRGAFAAAIWDPRRRTLTLARDHLGRNVVMWHHTPQFFAFASMPKGLLALPDVPRELNQQKLADFLVLNHAEHETTFYRGVFRLPPAHVLTIGPDATMSIRRFWSLADIRPVRLGSDDAYAEGLRACLDQAVRRHLRSAHPVGCYLSGGLDSSAVAALAARALAEKGERLAAFTHVPREGFRGPVPGGRYGDETPYVEAIRETLGNIDVTYVRNDDHDDFADLERVFLAMEGPVRNPTNLGWMMAIPRLASAQKRRVLLGGDHGNWTISWTGWSQAVDHVLQWRLATAFRIWRLCYRSTGYSGWTSFRNLFLQPLVPQALTAWLDRRRHAGSGAWHRFAAINPRFADEMGCNARAEQLGHDFSYRPRRNSIAWRMAGLNSVDYAGDWNAAMKAIHGVEVRDPPGDVDVVAFCLGVPVEQYLVEDVERSLIRRAMWGLLPTVVLTNRLTGLQAPDWYEKLASRRGAVASELDDLASLPLADKALDLPRLNRAIESWPQDQWHTPRVINEYHLALTRALASGRFIRWFESANR